MTWKKVGSYAALSVIPLVMAISIYYEARSYWFSEIIFNINAGVFLLIMFFKVVGPILLTSAYNLLPDNEKSNADEDIIGKYFIITE